MRAVARKDGDQSGEPRVIPAYYCCYLLRSLGTGYKTRKTALYIGSTPDPARRLAQHNGLAKGGACKTADEKRRPWEMVIVVEGFTSHIAALQFEWAWQHPAATRHTAPDVLDDSQDKKGGGEEKEIPVTEKGQQKVKAQKGTKSGGEGKDDGAKIDDERAKKTKRKPPARRTRTSLKAHLEDLHILLRSSYFSSWPLTLRFFVAEVAQTWRGWCDRVDGLLPSHIKTIGDGNCTEFFADLEGRYARVGSIQNIKVNYSPVKDYLEKASFLLDDIEGSSCTICQAEYKENELAVVCPNAGCMSTSHLLCLSANFLHSQESDRFVPLDGKCPTCLETIEWSLMMKELSIRTRSKEKVQAVLDKCGNKSQSQKPSKKAPSLARAQVTEAQTQPKAAVTVADDTLNDDSDNTDSLDDYWDKVLGSDSDPDSICHRQQASKVPCPEEVVIEDSELDDEGLND
ncbi:hypothetical protein BDV06DRAFT_211490 [Aspergillus oleicola]